MVVFYGRFKHGKEWSKTWHKIIAKSKDEALGKFIKGTYWKPNEVQITKTEPKQ